MTTGEFVGGFATDMQEGDTVRFLRLIASPDFKKGDSQLGVELCTAVIEHLSIDEMAHPHRVRFNAWSRILRDDTASTAVVMVFDSQDLVEILFPDVDIFRQTPTGEETDLRFATGKVIYRDWYQKHLALREKEMDNQHG